MIHEMYCIVIVQCGGIGKQDLSSVKEKNTII